MAGNDERLFLRTSSRRLIWPVPDRASSLFRETDPRPALERHIAKIRWGHERIPDSGLRERIVPDGAVRLVFVFPVGDLPPYGLAVGASSQPAIVELAGDIQHLEVELRPGAIPALFGIPAAELSDRAVPLHELWGDRAAIGQESLLTAADSGQRVAIIQDTLSRLLGDPGPDLPSVMTEAQRRIARAAGNLRVSTLANELGISDRRLEQLFRLHVGLSPKMACRLARFQGSLDVLLATPDRPPSWAELALDRGYFDQSHLVNEFQSMTGLAPRQFQQRAGFGFFQDRRDGDGYLVGKRRRRTRT